MSTQTGLAALRQRLAWVIAQVGMRLQPLINRWRIWPIRAKFVVAGGALALLLAVSLLGYRAVRGCSTRDAVMDRVALVTSGLQDAVAHHRITIEDLAGALKRINTAANAYQISGDPQAFCSVLNEVSSDKIR